MLDWFDAIAIASISALPLVVLGEAATRLEGLAKRRRAFGLYGRAVGLGLLLVIIGGKASTQPLQVIGTGILVAGCDLFLATAVAEVARVRWIGWMAAGATVVVGVLVLVPSSNTHAWCLNNGTLSDLDNCVGAGVGVLIGWLVVGLGAAIGLVRGAREILALRARRDGRSEDPMTCADRLDARREPGDAPRL